MNLYKRSLHGTAMHGDAWKVFCKEMVDKQYGDEPLRDAWSWFLSGWLAKAKQQDQLRNRR